MKKWCGKGWTQKTIRYGLSCWSVLHKINWAQSIWGMHQILPIHDSRESTQWFHPKLLISKMEWILVYWNYPGIGQRHWQIDFCSNAYHLQVSAIWVGCNIYAISEGWPMRKQGQRNCGPMISLIALNTTTIYKTWLSGQSCCSRCWTTLICLSHHTSRKCIEA